MPPACPVASRRFAGIEYPLLRGPKGGARALYQEPKCIRSCFCARLLHPNEPSLGCTACLSAVFSGEIFLDNVLQQAENLGKAIARNERYRTLQEVNERVESDPITRQNVEEYHSCNRLAEEREQAGQSLSPEERERLEKNEREIRDDAKIQELLRVQADFAEMMSKVYRTLEETISAAPPSI